MIRPTADLVRSYALSIGYDLDGEAFCDFYEMKGWKVGKNSMVDWKAAVRTWKRAANPDKREQERRNVERRAHDLPKYVEHVPKDEDLLTPEDFVKMKEAIREAKRANGGVVPEEGRDGNALANHQLPRAVELRIQGEGD